MGFYDKYILPKVIHWVCSQTPVTYQRKKVVPLAKGRVLEIGIGSGLNLPFYDPAKVERVWGLEPSEQMRNIAQKRIFDSQVTVDFIGLSGEEIPLEKNDADTILVTYTLCTIPSVLTALGEMRRVLKPGGELIFSEHGEAPDENVRRWQERLNPIWGYFGGGCQLNRPIPRIIEEGGFKIKNIDTMYLPGFKPAGFNYWGTAVPN
ncbi:MAG: class I SAM-dependent methyltransferase [Desulfobacula sp.]|nr:class I SAM-dependent methyltransferase [Desulfobacula sp.]